MRQVTCGLVPEIHWDWNIPMGKWASERVERQAVSNSQKGNVTATLIFYWGHISALGASTG